jgi:hypothetical protein
MCPPAIKSSLCYLVPCPRVFRPDPRAPKRYMDFIQPKPEMFRELEKKPWMSEGEMSKFTGRIVADGGDARRIGQVTQYDIRKQVGENLVSLSMTVRPDFVAVIGNIQPGVKDLFKAEDWEVIKNLTHNGLMRFEDYHGGLPRYVTVESGGGRNPFFEYYALDRFMLAAFVLRVFKVMV